MEKKRKLAGVIIPAITPFDDEGKPDLPVFRDMLEFYIKAGVHGLFVAGSAGQGPVMPLKDRQLLAETAIDTVRNRVPLIIHVGCADTESTIELGLHAKNAGATAIAAITPFYYSDHSEYEIYAHYSRLAKAVGDLPIVLYDNQRYAGIHITPSMVKLLVSGIPSICGIKLSYAAVPEMLEYVKVTPKEFAVISGGILNLLPSYYMGVSASIHPPSSPFPELCLEFWSSLVKKDFEGILGNYEKLHTLTSLATSRFKGNSRSYLRTALRARGFDVKRYPRWQTEEPSKDDVDYLTECINKTVGQVAIPIRR